MLGGQIAVCTAVNHYGYRPDNGLYTVWKSPQNVQKFRLKNLITQKNVPRVSYSA